MLLQSFNPPLTKKILESKNINPRKWDKIVHASKNIITLYKTESGGRKVLVVKVEEKKHVGFQKKK